MKHNAQLRALRFRAQRLAEKVPQAQSLPDPTANLALGSLPETAAGRVDAMAGLSQKIPFPGKRRAASGAARAEALAMRAEALAYQLKLAEQVHRAWWDLHLSQTSIEIMTESRDLLQSVAETVEARVAASEASQSDQLRIANEITAIDRDLAETRGLQKTARARLNSLLNRPAGAPLPVAARATPAPAGNLDALMARAASSHPEITAASHQVAAFQHRLRRAQLEKFPDLTMGVQSAAVASSGLAPSANGDDQIFGTLGFNLPLWQKPRRAMIREAKAGISETKALLESKRADLRYRVEEAYFDAQTARDVSRLFETRLLPDARQAYQVTLDSYAAGEESFTSLIESWREWLTYQLQDARTRARLGKAIATLKAAAGTS